MVSSATVQENVTTPAPDTASIRRSASSVARSTETLSAALFCSDFVNTSTIPWPFSGLWTDHGGDDLKNSKLLEQRCATKMCGARFALRTGYERRDNFRDWAGK